MENSAVMADVGASIPGNIYLTGLMGAGKTSVGRVLAKRFGKTFFDSDQEIERRTGVRIPVIFEIEGEAGFRRREAQVLAELTRESNIVLATGGGAILDPTSRALLRSTGTVIYLRAEPNDLWLRTRHDRNRPLLQGENPLRRLTELREQRDPLYRETAHLIVDTGAQTIRSLVGRIERDLRAHFMHRQREASAHDVPAA
jgi:shikimate kinase